ncbi:MAG: bifunctional hydroxymethylpyrimidine kinase/phosphomethylpyrimidine kinase [Bacteroidota bacterium]
MTNLKQYPRVLTIAGTDPSGGAGIQADLKTISACECYGTSAITALVAQNTQGVQAVHTVPVDFLQLQLKAVLDDVGTDTVKIGMLHSTEVILTVKKIIQKYQLTEVVLDPVMVATSGDTLLMEEAIHTLKYKLIPRVKIITPNIPEAAILLEEEIEEKTDLLKVAKEIALKYGVSVLLKGGHRQGEEVSNVLYDFQHKKVKVYTHPKVTTKNTHGTGCTLSSAIAAFLARAYSLEEAAEKAIGYIASAVKAGAQYQLGKGHGPVHHFFNYWG